MTIQHQGHYLLVSKTLSIEIFVTITFKITYLYQQYIKQQEILFLLPKRGGE